ncbi:hypothetical protein M23134_01268 [Microscilla marina ATCC 23134]|uniref:Uncharacterized protein n=1 Tax=Microscilla marina ATCC 23134 TaxID=313606 RepID=A2A0D7_MICM2|nr:hypothetical protein M23134_01268 [Microscilla marina ATCC 23134]
MPGYRYSLSVGQQSRTPALSSFGRQGCHAACGSLLPPRAAQWHLRAWLPAPPRAFLRAFLIVYFQKKKKPFVSSFATLFVWCISAHACPTWHPQNAYRSRSLGGSAGILQPSSFAQAYPRKTATPLGFGCEHGRAPTRG